FFLQYTHFDPKMMQLRNRKIDTASGVAQDKVTRARGRGAVPCATSTRQCPANVSEAIGCEPRSATTRKQHAESISQTAVQPTAVTMATTKAGNIRKRMSWSTEMNTIIMRLYYTVTNLETDMTMYRQKLYKQFKNLYPQLEVTEGRVADQRRAIVTRNL